MTMVRSASRFLAAIALAGVSACGSDEPGETRVAIIATDADSQQAVLDAATAQGLVAFDARGQVQPALAESWHVSDDGRSYIFRLARGEWSGGEPIKAGDVAAAIRRALEDAPYYDSLGAVDDVVAMTERVIEIRLREARPHLLQLLAQPAMAIRLEDEGSGPFMLGESEDGEADRASTHLMRQSRNQYDEITGTERVHIDFEDARAAIAAFVGGDAELVLGGTFASLPLVRDAGVPRTALRYDPVAGLFGLRPTGTSVIATNEEARRILSRSIDRAGLIDALGVPALAPRTTLLQDGIDLPRAPLPPQWAGGNDEAREGAAAAWRALFATDEDAPPQVVGIALPEGPGADILLERLREDWRPLGLDVQRVEPDAADFILIDEVAPSSRAAWFPRRLTCTYADICDPEIDDLLDAGRNAAIVAQRHAILLDAGARIDAAALFIPLTAPIRWSLVGPSITGFAENTFARHPLTGLKAPLAPEIAR